MEIQQLEIDLWQSLETATRSPETANLQLLCDALEQALPDWSLAEQLQMAGNILVQLSELCAARSQLMIAGWEHRHTPSEPIVDLEECVDLFVQSLSLDVTELFEEPELVQYPANRKQRLPLDINDSVVGEVDKAMLLNLVDELSKEPILNEIELAEKIRNLAHGENVEASLRAIKQALQSLDQTVRLVELKQILQMSMVEVWLGLLLGGYELEQKGGFYDTRSIWITNNDGSIAVSGR